MLQLLFVVNIAKTKGSCKSHRIGTVRFNVGASKVFILTKTDSVIALGINNRSTNTKAGFNGFCHV